MLQLLMESYLGDNRYSTGSLSRKYMKTLIAAHAHFLRYEDREGYSDMTPTWNLWLLFSDSYYTLLGANNHNTAGSVPINVP